MTKKIGDIASRIGTYQKDGQDRGRYVTFGTLFQGEDGSFFGSIDPYYDLGKIHDLQRRDDHKRGREVRDSLNITIFTDEGRTAGTPGKPVNFDDLDTPF